MTTNTTISEILILIRSFNTKTALDIMTTFPRSKDRTDVTTFPGSKDRTTFNWTVQKTYLFQLDNEDVRLQIGVQLSI